MSASESSESSKSTPKRNKRYWFRLIRFFLILTTIVVLGLPIGFGIFSVSVLVYADCKETSKDPSDYGASLWENFSVDASAGGTFNGYFVEGTNGATIIFPPNFSAGRGWRLPEASVLIKNGYSVVTFESRRCAGMGPMSLGYQEVQEVHDVIGYLQARGDIDLSRIGIHGFSSSGATAIMATARYPEIKAVVAEGGYADMDALLRDQTGELPFLVGVYRWSMRLSYRVIIGESLDSLNPLSVIKEIAPRPILLVYGSKEVSLEGGRVQLTAAGDNAELWIVDGAAHGDYLKVAPEAYEARMVEFFNTALLDSN